MKNLLILLLFLSTMLGCAAGKAESEKRILLIYSQNMGFAQHYQIAKAFCSEFNKQQIRYRPIQFELNAMSHPPETFQKRFEPFLEELRNNKFDAVITLGDPALDLLRENVSSLRRDLPVLFYADQETGLKFHNVHPRSTGIVDTLPGAANAELALRLFPGTRQIFLLTNWTPAGAKIREQIKEFLRRYPNVELIAPDNKTVDSVTVLKMSRKLPPKSVILFYGWYNTNALNFASLQYLLSALGNVPNTPLFVMNDAMLKDYRTIGGVMSLSEEAAAYAGKMLYRIFHGYNPQELAIETIPIRPVLNWPVLRTYRVPQSAVPRDAKLLSQPASLLEKNFSLIVLGMIAMFVFILMLTAAALLFVSFRRQSRRRAALFAHLPNRIGVADERGRILFAHKGAFRKDGNYPRLADFPLPMRELFEGKVAEVFKTNATALLDYEYNGSFRHVEFFPLDESVFRTRAVMWVSSDMSSQEEARRHLQNAKQLRQNIVDSLPASVYMKDSESLRYTFCNRIMCSLLNRSQEEILGRTDKDFFGEEYQKIYEALEREALEKDEPVTGTIPFFAADGSPRKGILLARPQVNEQGVRELFGCVFDVTKELQLSEDLHTSLRHQSFLNSVLEQTILIPNKDEAILFVQNSLRIHLCADCAFILKFDYKENVMSFHSTYIVGPASPLIRGFSEHLSIPKDESWFQSRNQRKPGIFPDISQTETDHSFGIWAAHARKHGVRSVYTAGIFIDNKLWGSLGLFYSSRHVELSRQDIQLLQNAGHVIELLLIQKRMHERLERSENEKRLVLETIPIPVLLFNDELSLQTLNKAAREMYHTVGLSDNDAFESIRKEETGSPDSPLILTEKDHQIHTDKKTLNGREYSVSTHPILQDGRLANVLETFIDMTEFNRSQRELLKAMQAAQQASKAKSFFLASMSHELRTPLNAVIGACELLQTSELGRNERDEYLKSISVAGNTLLRLINDILDLSKIESEEISLSPQPTNLSQLIAELQQVFRQAADKKNLYLRTALPDNVPLFELDALRLRQILLNLIGNALKFTAEGGITVGVTYTPGAKNRALLKISVTDTGIGIAPDKLKSIFEPFVQQDALRDTLVYKGTGLGLAISSKMSQRMGGVIELQSELGTGSCFTLILEDVPMLSSSPESEFAPAKNESIPLSGYEVLLVDDIPINLRVLGAMLVKQGIQVRTAGSGQAALAELEKRQPDLVLTDMWMPEMNGKQLADAIRANPAWRRIRIVAVTADTESAANFKCDNLDATLLKPVSTEKIVQLFADLVAAGKLEPKPCDS